jgi:hypothetical protein
MNNQIRRAFRTTKVKINELSPEVQQEIEQLFLNMEAAKTDAVTAEREAGKAVNQAQIRRANAHIAELNLLMIAATHFTQVAGDRVWIPYKDKNGVITFEGFTERLLRNNMRAQQEMIGRQLAENNELDGESGAKYDELYEDENEEGEGESEA